MTEPDYSRLFLLRDEIMTEFELINRELNELEKRSASSQHEPHEESQTKRELQ